MTEEEAPRLDVITRTRQLQQRLHPHRVEMLHGQMKSAEKEAVMARFAAGETGVLVSTTVVEVGVDVPNAALMVVENAERFGLSQLHQLRGRVGRGPHASTCVLISDATNEVSLERLGIMKKSDNGFEIAEKDLALRGPGDFFGQRQHGLPALSTIGLAGDLRPVEEAQRAAADLLSDEALFTDPAYRPLLARMQRLFDQHELTLN